VALDHVALTVADRERSAAFYGEHFGLTDRVHDDEHLLILSGPGGGLLALSEGEPAAAGLPVRFSVRCSPGSGSVRFLKAGRSDTRT
jgi:catechol 2,3-dioxygenase-like lactoylglutathione lyase family enzyme